MVNGEDMKLHCRTCYNQDEQKFAPTKAGFICLACYERTVDHEAENQKEIAEFEIRKHLSKSSGGNNRKFTRAYLGMKNYLDFMANMPEQSDSQKVFISGFSKAIEIFEKEAR